MPSLIELAGLFGNGDQLPIPPPIPMLAPPPGKKGAAPKISAAKALEVAERLLIENKPQGAYIWARRALKQAQTEKKSAIAKRAKEIIKALRGSAAIKMLAALGDIDGIIQGRKLGLW